MNCLKKLKSKVRSWTLPCVKIRYWNLSVGNMLAIDITVKSDILENMYGTGVVMEPVSH